MTTMSGKTCLVTGATSGIGKETAVRLAMLGATVIIVARTAARGEAAAEEIRRRVPRARVEAVTADLANSRVGASDRRASHRVFRGGSSSTRRR